MRQDFIGSTIRAAIKKNSAFIGTPLHSIMQTTGKSTTPFSSSLLKK
eukprot:CCRYP_017076-RB/>CCRYP_017076-RB protein AED:0.23 eAED:1.00 QI:0/-1/0/1/-1/0/1/0/46